MYEGDKLKNTEFLSKVLSHHKRALYLAPLDACSGVIQNSVPQKIFT